MPKFYFNIRDTGGLSRDLEGQELPDMDTARREGVSAAREILGEQLLHGGSLNGRTIEMPTKPVRWLGGSTRVTSCFRMATFAATPTT